MPEKKATTTYPIATDIPGERPNFLMNTNPTNCSRCRAPLRSYTVSRFNTETICLECSDDERQAPGYRLAAETETNAVRSGDYNFPGIGLGPEDREFLRTRLSLRIVRSYSEPLNEPTKNEPRK